jgi:hypothetical protein
MDGVAQERPYGRLELEIAAAARASAEVTLERGTLRLGKLAVQRGTGEFLGFSAIHDSILIM